MKMTRIFAVLFAIAFSATSMTAQNYYDGPGAFEKGQIDANFGIGLNMTTIANGTKAYVAPVSASIDYAIGKKISIGASFGYAAIERYVPEFKIRRAKASDDPSIIEPSKEEIMAISTRFLAHYNKLEKLDFYGGPIIGMRYSLVTPIDDVKSISGMLNNETTERKVSFGAVVGARYHILPNLGIFGEFGAMHAAFQIGLNFNM